MKPNPITQIMDNLLVVQLTPARSCYLRLCRFVSKDRTRLLRFILRIYIKSVYSYVLYECNKSGLY